MMSRWSAALLVVGALALCPALALASPPDPLWIGGVYDAGDWDEAVLTSAFAEGIAVPDGAGDLRRPGIAVGAVEPGPPAWPASRAFSAFGSRAPPGA
jgi:hypothetical protein